MPAAAPGPFLFVGFQRGVLPALRRLQRPAVALIGSDRALPEAPELEAARGIDLHGPPEPIAGVAESLLEGREPAAVVALSERTVLVAARLREHFGLGGNGPETALRCADKAVMKEAMEAHGIAVAPWRLVTAETRAEELLEILGSPVVLKPRRDSGGRGQSVLHDRPQLARALAELASDGSRTIGSGWLAEGWVDGVEMSLESFVHAGGARFHNPTEYFVPRHANVLPAALAREERDELTTFVELVLAAAGVERGVTHLELFRTARGPVLGELAIRPPGGRLMTLLQRAWGFDPWEAMLRLESGEPFDFPEAPRRVAGVWILHPGRGRVASIEGLEEARKVPCVRRLTLKVAPGDVVGEREGSGQDIGSVYAEGADRDTVAEALTRAHSALGIRLEDDG